MYCLGDCFWFQLKDKGPNMYLKTSFDQLVAFLQVLQPNFSLWAIMAQPRVITSFQSSCGIGLNKEITVKFVESLVLYSHSAPLSSLELLRNQTDPQYDSFA